MDLSTLHSYVSDMSQEIIFTTSREARWTELSAVYKPLYAAVLSNQPASAIVHLGNLVQSLFSLNLAPHFTEALKIIAHAPTLRLLLRRTRLSPEAQQRALTIIREDMDMVALNISAIRDKRETLARWLGNAEPQLRKKTAMMLRRAKTEEEKEEEEAIEEAIAEKIRKGLSPTSAVERKRPSGPSRPPTPRSLLVEMIIRRRGRRY